MEFLTFYCLPMLATVPATAILCRFWLSRKKRISYGSVIAAPCIIFFALLVLDSGGRCFTPSYWSSEIPHKDPNWPFSMLRDFGFIAVICALPALAVVTYYQSRTNETQTNSA